jgi:peptidoglycan/xylan/chitin deacetylase (PgdA/CDA1 family)
MLSRSSETKLFGVMFHHFTQTDKPDALGSITAERLNDIIIKIGKDRVLSAQEWSDRAISGALPPDAVCLTFDDALRSQIDIALPVLEHHNLTAFWFIYSSVFEGCAPGFEVYRYFYNNNFSDFDEFFHHFLCRLQAAKLVADLPREREKFAQSDYLREFKFYSDNEREYRFLRDQVLGSGRFDLIMDKMIEASGLNREQVSAQLWMDNDDLLTLTRNRHVVGLHSYTHPTNLRSLPYIDQVSEYERNLKHIVRVTGESPRTMAHPVNSYSAGTLKILRTMGIELGFRSNPDQGRHSALEYPRIDCINQ